MGRSPLLASLSYRHYERVGGRGWTGGRDGREHFTFCGCLTDGGMGAGTWDAKGHFLLLTSLVEIYVYYIYYGSIPCV